MNFFTDTTSFKVIPFVLVTLLAVGGVEGFYRYADRYISSNKLLLFPDAATVRKKKSVLPQGAGKNKQKDYNIIVARGLFKEPAKKAIEKPSVITEAKANISSIDFALIGTITGKDDGARAILLNKKKKTQEIFYTGDGFENVTVKDISRGKIVLNVGGKTEILLMEESKRAQSPSSMNPGPIARPKPKVKPAKKSKLPVQPRKKGVPGQLHLPPDQ